MAIKANSVFPKSSRTPEQKVQSAQGGSGKISTRDYASVTRSISLSDLDYNINSLEPKFNFSF